MERQTKVEALGELLSVAKKLRSAAGDPTNKVDMCLFLRTAMALSESEIAVYGFDPFPRRCPDEQHGKAADTSDRFESGKARAYGSNLTPILFSFRQTTRHQWRDELSSKVISK